MSGDDDDFTDQPVERPELDVGQPDAASPKEQRKRETEVKRLAREEREFWQGVMAHPVGRRVIFSVLQRCGTFKVEFAATGTGFPHPDAQNYANGQRDLGIWLYHELGRLAREGLFLMLDEHDSRFKAELKAGK